ncbi:6-phosphogluconolactonase [Candidatus Woesearchaeota archaeon]|nr:6-phosphogluconolactonase [Candidatus Woesearchaeota archaeon]
MVFTSPKIRVFDNPEELGKAAAEKIIAEYKQKGKLVLGIPWGTTPVPILDAFAKIVKDEQIDLANFHAVMMDEYVVKSGSTYSFVDLNWPVSGRYHWEKDLLKKLPSKQAAQFRKNTHFPDPNDPQGFESLIDSLGGVDIFIIATGAHDGHVAQNGPGTPLSLGTRVLALPKTVIEYNFEKMKKEFDNDINNVPRFGVSIGLSTILKSRKLIFIAFGEGKAKITQRLLSARKFDKQWPITFLWNAMEKTEILLDREAAGKLETEGFLNKALDVAIAAAKEAGNILLRHYKSELQIDFKNNNIRSIVTNADKECDAAITKKLLKEFPEYGIVSEESEPVKGNGLTWYVDPLDGTTNYSRKGRYFCVSIALAKGNDLLVGAIYDPLNNELWTATAGNGAYLNGKRLKVSGISALTESYIYCDFGYHTDRRKKMINTLSKLTEAKSIRHKGSGALETCEVAAGNAECYIHYGSKSWDYAASTLLVREAGGLALDINGKEWTPFTENGIIAGNKAIVKAVLDKVKE